MRPYVQIPPWFFKPPVTLTILALFAVASDVRAAEVLPVPDETHNRVLPKDQSLQSEITYKKLYDEEREKQQHSNDSIAKRLQEIRAGMKDQAGTSVSSSTSSTPITNDGKRVKTGAKSRNRNVSISGAVSAPRVSYVVTESAASKKTVIPIGSVARAIPLTGLEATALEPAPLLLALTGSFLTPNKKHIDLTDCFMLAKAKANLSTERVIGETTEISCVRENGEHIRRAAPGFIAGTDGTFGVQGKLISNQRQVFLTSVLASLAKGAGEAVAMAQKTTTVVQGPAGSLATTNVTGSQALLVAGQATTDASAMIAEWYLTFAKQLVPSIAIGASGDPVWITLLDTIEIPSLHSDEEE